MKPGPAIWRAPLAVGALSLAGLLIALFADGIADLVSVAALCVPVWLGVQFGYLRNRTRREGP
jgi:hypothetical protein